MGWGGWGVSKQDRLRRRTGRERNEGGGKKQEEKKIKECSREEGEVESLL